jgi:hypothetical protein
MIITRLMGGLGNQMFQYAAGRALSLRLNVPLKLDLSWFADMRDCTPRAYMLHIFPITATEATPEEIGRVAYRKQNFFEKLLRKRRRSRHYIAEPFGCRPDFAALAAPAYLDGYWQRESYFADAADTIRRDFTFPPLGGGPAEELAARMRAAANSVCVHIRRGDYVENPATRRFHGVCSPAYYETALRMIARKCGGDSGLFLFTDDPAWAREHFDAQGFPSTVVDCPGHAEAPWHDMHLMTLCTHHIIANSSFSWWGAWAATGNGIIAAPKRWFAAAEKQGDNPAPARWITL